MLILVLNAGSTSMKFKLFDMKPDNQQVIAEGNCQRVGIRGSEVRCTGPDGKKQLINTQLANHLEAMDFVLALLREGESSAFGLEKLSAIGHRIAVGGTKMLKATLIDEQVICEVEKHAYIAPLHSPPQVATIRACQKLLGGGFPMVAGFDTAFHQSIPKEIYFCPIPYEYYENFGVRRMGFHGLSHQYITERYGKLSGKGLEGSRIVSCHLGGGVSLSAVKDGRSLDNSLGFGTGEGLMCGTRAGGFDHSAIAHLIKVTGKSFETISNELTFKSGLLGVSGVSGDARDVEEAAAAGNERAQLALDMLAVQIKKYMGSYTFLMGGLDAVIFSGGIGENSSYIRKQVCRGLENLGIKLDSQLNTALNQKEGRISAQDSPVGLWVIPTNEELVIARDTFTIVHGG